MEVQQQKKLIAFDFDWSLLDENSDAWVVKQLAPDFYDQWRNLYRDSDQTWSEFMDDTMGRLHQLKVEREQVDECFRTVPMRAAMVEAVRYCKDNNCDLIIISAANEFFIEAILKHFGMRDIFSAIHTHKARWCDGRMRVRAYHAPNGASTCRVHEKLDNEEACEGEEEEDWRPHSCQVCTPDLCKGEILRTYIQSGRYDRVFYVGDSENDWCPSALLSKDDHVLLRKNFSLHNRLLAGENRLTITANIHLWERAEDVRDIFKRHIPPVPSLQA